MHQNMRTYSKFWFLPTPPSPSRLAFVHCLSRDSSLYALLSSVDVQDFLGDVEKEAEEEAMVRTLPHQNVGDSLVPPHRCPALWWHFAWNCLVKLTYLLRVEFISIRWNRSAHFEFDCPKISWSKRMSVLAVITILVIHR